MTQIITLDLNHQNIPQTVAAYLIMAPEGPVLVETGPASTKERLAEELGQHGFTFKDIKHVLLTHIHLDHSGAAGWLAQAGAQLYVHEVGAPHLVDPSKLLSSAGRIYGDRMGSLWGETVAAPAERVTAVSDNQILRIAGLQFMALNTPGHAWHHHTYRLGDIGFTGDATGIRLPGLSIVDVPAPPPEFKLDVWHKTLDRLENARFTAIYPTHFGKITDVAAYLSKFRVILDASATFVRERMERDLERDQIVVEYIAWNHGRSREIGLSDVEILQLETANPLTMSVDGIMRYWQRKFEKD